MANIIHELAVELARVRALLEQLDPMRRIAAEGAIRYGSQSMALNSYEEMREAVDDLREFKK
jgi:hypothetical protein